MKMWRFVTLIARAGWLCVFLAAAADSTEPGSTVYGKVGGEVVLKPSVPVTEPIKQITWRIGNDLAVELEGDSKEFYRHFIVRGSLKNSTGEMTLKGLLQNDSGIYTPEINRQKLSPIKLIVIFPVPTPIITKGNTGDLICDGNTTGAEPVTYTWKNDNVTVSYGKTYTISQGNSSSSNEFICVMTNPVSEERSELFLNPSIPPPTNGPDLNISKGLTVLIVLLTALILLVLFHRLKTGMFFYNKDSMPWQADFWRKHERQTSPSESNGTTARDQKGDPDEETPMT